MVLEVRVFNNNVEKAMRKLKRKVQREGLLKELKQRQFYEKPSLKRQRKLKEGGWTRTSPSMRIRPNRV